MSINIEQVIKWMRDHQKSNITYSMNDREGPNSYDCSSSIYKALRSAGGSDAGWTLDTKHLHQYLLNNGFKRVADNSDWEAKRGDIFIWGTIPGAASHTGIFIDHDNIIHMNYSSNGISVGNHDKLWVYAGRPFFRAYRYNGPTSSQQETNETKGEEYMDRIELKKRIKGGFSIDSLPWDKGDHKQLGLTAAYEGQIVTLTRKWGSYYHVQELGGWVDYRAFSDPISLDNLANQIINGDWGNGQDRVNKLKAAGYSDEDIAQAQKLVNNKL